MTDIVQYPSDHPIEMTAQGPWPAAVHRFKPEAVAALRAAEATNRPLLIRGLPGVGKSMTARAAAWVAGRPLLYKVIDGRTEAQDLMARFDAVRRLADAQVARPGADGQAVLPPEASYLSPGPLWWAFHWCGALRQQQIVQQRQDATRPTTEPTPVPDGWARDHGRAVLLLDEIDKADPDLPNALLETLGSNGFTAPVTGQEVACPASRRPLIILTTNEERELPAAVLRRCLVLTLTLPTAHKALVRELQTIGEQHQQWLMDPQVAQRSGPCLVMREAASAIADARLANADGSYQPGTSEFLDLVAALATLWPGQAAEQKRQLKELQGLVLRKSAPPAA